MREGFYIKARRIYPTIVFLLGLILIVNGQSGIAIFSTKYSDSFEEWLTYEGYESTEPNGIIERRWKSGSDWTIWDFKVGDNSGQIKSIRPNSNEEWDLRVDGQLISMRTRWPRDLSAWKIQIGDKVYFLNVVAPPLADHWEVSINERCTLELFTEFEDDPRSWIISYSHSEIDCTYDSLLELASAFIVLFNSTPKY